MSADGYTAGGAGVGVGPGVVPGVGWPRGMAAVAAEGSTGVVEGAGSARYGVGVVAVEAGRSPSKETGGGAKKTGGI